VLAKKNFFLARRACILTGQNFCVLFSQGTTFVSYSHRAAGHHCCVLLSQGTTFVSQDADNATVHWALEPIRRPKASTGPRSARPKAGTACTGARECRPKAGTDLHWGTECRPKAGTGARSARPKAGTACTGARECRPKAGTDLHWGTACTGARECRPKAGTGLHWGHIGVPCCRPKAGAGWAEGPALRRAQCARGAVSNALCSMYGAPLSSMRTLYILLYYIYC